MQRKFWGIINADFDTTALTDFKKTYYSVMKEVLYNIFIEFGIRMKLVRLIKMCLNETYEYSRVRFGQNCLMCFLLGTV
jgi:hypothetical protein